MGWFFELDWRIRLAIPILLLIVNAIVFFAGYIFWWLVAINLVTFLFSGRSANEKNGYGNY